MDEMDEYDYITPDHYKKKFRGEVIEVADIADIWDLTRWEFAALKHLLRDGKPNQAREQDLDKAVWYIQRERARYIQRTTPMHTLDKED